MSRNLTLSLAGGMQTGDVPCQLQFRAWFGPAETEEEWPGQPKADVIMLSETCVFFFVFFCGFDAWRRGCLAGPTAQCGLQVLPPRLTLFRFLFFSILRLGPAPVREPALPAAQGLGRRTPADRPRALDGPQRRDEASQGGRRAAQGLVVDQRVVRRPRAPRRRPRGRPRRGPRGVVRKPPVRVFFFFCALLASGDWGRRVAVFAHPKFRRVSTLLLLAGSFYLQGWSRRLLPSDRPSWSSLDGSDRRDLDMVDLRPGWVWKDEWHVDLARPVDVNGWECVGRRRSFLLGVNAAAWRQVRL